MAKWYTCHICSPSKKFPSYEVFSAHLNSVHDAKTLIQKTVEDRKLRIAIKPGKPVKLICNKKHQHTAGCRTVR